MPPTGSTGQPYVAIVYARCRLPFLSGAHSPQPKHWLPVRVLECLTEHASLGHTVSTNTPEILRAWACFSQELSVLSYNWVCPLSSCHLLQSFLWRNRFMKAGLIPWHSCEATTPCCYAPHLTGTFNWCQVSKTFRVRIPWGHSSLLPCLPTKNA